MGKLFYFLWPVLLLTLMSYRSAGQPYDKNFHVYVLLGQSNMAGRGKITGEFTKVNDPRVLMLTKTLEWKVATHPLHFDKPIAGVGPGLRFGIIMADAKPGKKIGLVPSAVGGTSIDLWVPGAYDSLTKTHPYDDAVLRIREAMKHGVVKGVIWLQGESDSDPVKSLGYMSKLEALILRLRLLTGNPELPFLAGELGQFNTQYVDFNRIILANLPNQVPQTGLVRSDNLEHQGDSIHFDAASAEQYGERFAQAMRDLQQK